MFLRSQMNDLMMKVLQKETEGYMRSDQKRTSVLALNLEINSEGDQSLRQTKSNSEAPVSDSIACPSDFPHHRKTEL